MFRKVRRGLLFLLIVLVSVAGGYVLSAGSPQAAVAQLVGMSSGAPGGPASALPRNASVADGQDVPAFAANGQNAGAAGQVDTIEIRSAGEAIGMVSAAGNIELAERQHVVLEVDGEVEEVAVRAGNRVSAGDLLVRLDPEDLEQEAEQALLDLASAQLQVQDLLEDADPAELAAAEADLHSAQEALADLQAGASEREVAAARSNAASAWSKYDELQAGPSEAELTQLSADMRKAEIAVQEARREYEKIAWRNDVGMTTQAADYEQATIDYEAALAAYEEATAPTTASELQSALSQAQSAQEELDQLLAGTKAADIADAEARVASAQSSLDQLLRGANSSELESARIGVEQAQLDLKRAAARLAKAQLAAPIGGTVLSVEIEKGEHVGAGTVAVVLADTSNLELVVNVAEVDVSQLTEGQAASITVDALPSRTFDGTVSTIAPASESEQGVVNYPVTIQLTGDNLSAVRSGMTAVATLRRTEVGSGWMVPASAVRESDGVTQVLVVRNGQPTPVQVTTGELQGEWIVVISPELQAGDQVVGTTASYLTDDAFPFGPGAGGGPPGGDPFGPQN